MLNVGIDIGKQKCVAWIKDDEDNVLRECTFLNNKDGIGNFIEELKRYGLTEVSEVRAVMEYTGTLWCRLYDELERTA